MFKQGKFNNNVIIMGVAFIVFLLLVIILLNFWVRLSIKEDPTTDNPTALVTPPSLKINNAPILKPGTSKEGIIENAQPAEEQKVQESTLTNEAKKPTTEPIREMPILSEALLN